MMKLAPLRMISAVLWGGALLGVSGCGSPSRANIELRKQNQKLETQIAQLRQQHDGDARVIQGLRDRRGTLKTLPATRLSELFTTHGIQFVRLTGGVDLDPNKPGDEGIAVYVVPVDQSGQTLKAAGSFDVEAYDLANPKSPLVGHWHFDLQQSKNVWNATLLDYSYVLTCPWQKVIPTHVDLTVKVTFFDALTQTRFTAQRVVKIHPPA